MLIVISVLLITFAAFAVFVWIAAVRSQTPKRRPSERTPDMPYEDVTWQSEGEPIFGWFFPPKIGSPDEQAPVIVIAHGWSSNRSSMLRYVPRLHEEGYALLLYDARSHGESGSVSAASGITMKNDLRAALDYVCSRPEIDRKRIGVLGHSLGAFAGALALGNGEHRIKAMVTDAMPARLSTMISAELTRRKLPLFPLMQLIPIVWRLRTGIPKRRYDPIPAINRSTTPILMIHSRNDGLIPWTELDHILKRIQRKVAYLCLENEGHSSSWTVDEFWDQTLTFYKKQLVPASTEKSADVYEI